VGEKIFFHFFLGVRVSLRESLFSRRERFPNAKNSNEKPNDYHDKKLRPLRGSQKIHRDNPEKQGGCFDLRASKRNHSDGQQIQNEIAMVGEI
jgi:hypothetical protein